MARIDPSLKQRQKLYDANAHRCCVCKRYDVGLHLHHIDEDSSNTIDENLAVLCVEDHDRHHRPAAYRVNHLDLGPQKIREHKRSWEAFVAETRKPSPAVIATLSAYGSYEQIHSLQLVLQWAERIEYSRSYHLLDGNMDKMTDAVMEELKDFGPGVQIAFIDKPLPIEHCPCCGSGYYRKLDPPVVIRHTDPDWSTQSTCAIYVRADVPWLELTFFMRNDELFHGSLHLCNGNFLHYHSDGIDERVAVRPKPSVRAQATRIVRAILKDWSPANVFIGTGSSDAPDMLEDLTLPLVWEKNAK
jgi:hypothetical protein